MKTTDRLNKFGTLENHRYLELIIEQFKETPTDECIDWPFSQNQGGYGQVWLGVEHRLELVHREAYLLYHGEYPQPFGLHTCDRPPCFNPSHIYAGTPADNSRDRWNRPIRQAKRIVGRRWSALENLIGCNPSNPEIARQFDITEESVAALRKLLPSPQSQKRQSKPPELTSKQVETILGLSQRGFPKGEIAFWFDIPIGMVDAITGRTWHRLPRPEEG